MEAGEEAGATEPLVVEVVPEPAVVDLASTAPVGTVVSVPPIDEAPESSAAGASTDPVSSPRDDA